MKNQKLKIKNLFIVSIVVFSMFILVRPAQAFWPFDLLKNKSAQETQNGNVFSPLVQKIIDKFNLNPDEVKGVIEETQKEKQAKMQQLFEEKLNEAVKNGEITEEQKQKILAKHEELKTERQAMQNKGTELKTWADENGIDPKYLFGGFGVRGARHRGFGKGLK